MVPESNVAIDSDGQSGQDLDWHLQSDGYLFFMSFQQSNLCIGLTKLILLTQFDVGLRDILIKDSLVVLEDGLETTNLHFDTDAVLLKDLCE